MLPPEKAASITGHPVGGVCPFGLPTPPPSIAMYCCKVLKWWSTAAGDTHFALLIHPRRLAEITAANWTSASARDRVVRTMRNAESIQDHIARKLPLARLFDTADNSSARVRLNGNASIVRPGGTVAGPVLFALADIAAYASTLMTRQDDLPLIGNATVLRAGRNAMVVDVQVWVETSGSEQIIAVATALWCGRAV